MTSHDAEHADVDLEMQQRRAVLKRVAWMLGGAVSAPAALAILQGCSAKETPAASWTPKFLSGDEGMLVSAIADTLIPKTDTSGALEAGVPAFIDVVLEAVYPKEAQARFKTGLAEFASAAKAAKGRSFQDLAPVEREAFLKESLETALGGARDPKPFVLMARELTLLGFFSSKVGIQENMEYVAVPTAYHGCVPLSEMKKHVYWE
jgi:gluconate 2-dehydrogenase gamma chain